MEENFEELAHGITIENGKVLDDARGEMRRAIENVEVACGIPAMMLGDFSEDIARGIDEYMIRQPVGVSASSVPSTSPDDPLLVPALCARLWQYGDRQTLRATPLTMRRSFACWNRPGFRQVWSTWSTAAETVNAILDHPAIRAVTFVGSTPVARHVYSRASASGKRVSAQGGAKNPLIILPDADVGMTTGIVTDSVFGNAGQRCLAAANIVTVGEAGEIFKPVAG